MLSPFTALLPRDSDVEYWALERAAKALRHDPARYQSVEGVEYDRSDASLFRWVIEFEGGEVVGIVGLFPIDRLVPHESIRARARHRPQHPVQIRPVMALIDDEVPRGEPTGPTVHFHGDHHHAVTPIAGVDLDIADAVIADGHHRVAAARRAGRHPSVMTLVVSSGSPLDAGAFHRVFDRAVALPAELPGCRVVAQPPREALHDGRIAVVTPEGAVGIEVVDPDPVLRDVPAGLAARHVLPPLGLDEAEATYVDEIRDALAASDGGATSVILPGSRLSGVLAAARASVVLPPKATRFRPKPIRGLLLRPLPDA